MIADPRAATLLELGDRIVELEAERQQLIEAIRLVHRMVPEPQSRAATTGRRGSRCLCRRCRRRTGSPRGGRPRTHRLRRPTALVAELPRARPPRTSTVVSRAAVEDPVADRTPPPQPPVAASVIARAPRRRLTVPVLLLIVGVSLVGVAAIFFLVLAWNIADIRMRALIIGGVTLATMVAAALLRRWSLRATAEAIGALGVILLGLDGWAVHANDLFGAGGMDPVVYAGVAALVIGVVCRVWSRDLAPARSRPRGDPGPSHRSRASRRGSASARDRAPRSPPGCSAPPLGGLAHALPAPWSAARSGRDTVPERTALMAIGVAALAGGAATTLLLGLESMAVQLVAAAVVDRDRRRLHGPAALARRRRTPARGARRRQCHRRDRGGFAASLGWQMALQSDLPVFPHLVAPVVAVGVAVALDRWQPRRRVLPAPLIAAAVVGVASIVALLAFSVQWAQQSIGGGWMLWHTPVFAAPAGSDLEAAILAAIAAVIVAVLLFLAPTLDRRGLREARPVAAAVVVLIGAAGTGIPIVIVGTAIVIAAIALVALARGAKPVGWGAAAGLGALGAFLGGLAMPGLWAVGVLVAVAVPITARVLVRPKQVGAVVLALTPVAVGVIAALIAPSAIGAFGVAVDGRAAFVLLQWVALVALASAVCAAPRRHEPHRPRDLLVRPSPRLLRDVRSRAHVRGVRVRGAGRADPRDRPHRRTRRPSRLRRPPADPDRLVVAPRSGGARRGRPPRARGGLHRDRRPRNGSRRRGWPARPGGRSRRGRRRLARGSRPRAGVWREPCRRHGRGCGCRARRDPGGADVRGARRAAARGAGRPDRLSDARAPIRRRGSAGRGRGGGRRRHRAGEPPLGDARGDRAGIRRGVRDPWLGRAVGC